MRFTLLSRAYCHLCDEMLTALTPMAAAHRAAIDVIDVDDAGNAGLASAWGDRVPILFAGDPDPANELCHYRIDRRRVEAALAGIAGFARIPEIR
jgi:thioredoxin reductase (NADPH)